MGRWSSVVPVLILLVLITPTLGTTFHTAPVPTGLPAEARSVARFTGETTSTVSLQTTQPYQERGRVMLLTAAIAAAALVIGTLGYLYRRLTGQIHMPTEEEYLAAQHGAHTEPEEETIV